MRGTEPLHPGQCGLCAHFGEGHPNATLASLVQKKEALVNLLCECGHMKHAALHLKVTPISGCDGFEPAAQA